MDRLLPVGIQDFVDIRKRGLCYVDKTALVHRLIAGPGQSYVLSRPRRFGKSLLCSTIRAIFEGRRELFGEIAGQPALAIDGLDWEWQKHPVIKVDLSNGVYSEGPKAWRRVLRSQIGEAAERLSIALKKGDAISQFEYLIRASHKRFGERVVIVIDEYDKPLLDSMRKPKRHEAIREKLKGFYGVLKSYEEHLRFVLITGVTRFAHVGISSDLNHLIDLTTNPDYAEICGFTQEEVDREFADEIEAIGKQWDGQGFDYRKRLRSFYNGYRFTKKPLMVYNPFGLLMHYFEKGEFEPYWYRTATPTFLVKLLDERKIGVLNLKNTKVTTDDFYNYDIENLETEPLLYQTGYLTVVDYDNDSGVYTLDFPNDEVRRSFAKSLLNHYLKPSKQTATSLYYVLLKALLAGDVEESMRALRSYVESIPYDIIINREQYYQTVMHLVFTMLGFGCRSEVRIAAGRMDALVETADFVYCFEFKLDKSADEALAQIDSKDYLLPWTGSGKKLFKVGVGIVSAERNIGDWKVVEIG